MELALQIRSSPTPASRMPVSFSPVVSAAASPISLGFSVLTLLLASVLPANADEVSFQEDVRPILSNHCFACHGPDENNNAAGFRLDI